jgi:hypothetical protein
MQSGANVSPLHRQRVKGRAIIVTEDSKLHLVWFYDHICLHQTSSRLPESVKPIEA